MDAVQSTWHFGAISVSLYCVNCPQTNKDDFMQKTVTNSKPFLEYPQTRKKKITALKAKQL